VTIALAAPAVLPTSEDVLAKAGTENFPVALRLLPSTTREQLMAIYGYARLVDDVGDELPGGRAARLAALDLVEAQLDLAIAGASEHPVFQRLGRVIAECSLPRQPFVDLIDANRTDQRVTRYPTFDSLLSYCALSADPVGRLVLRVFGQVSREADRLSDLVCSGLQVVEHLQDVAEDARDGRIYLPLEDLERLGVTEGDVLRMGAATASAVAPSPAFRRLIALEVERSRALLVEGAHLVRLLRGGARLAIAGFAGGGLAQLDAIERASYDVITSPVKAPKTAVAAAAARLVARRGRW
jgi:squalene synthase HpnC